MIVDKCPKCGMEYEWDSCQDVYPGCEEIFVAIEGREAVLFTCPDDGATVAISLTDAMGCEVYVPSTKEL